MLKIKLVSAYLHPNVCTLFAAVLGIVVIFAIALDLKILAVSLLMLSGFLDVLDGSLARYQSTSSELGTVLDILSDRFVEFAVILGLLLLAPADRAVWCVLMLGAVLLCVSSFLVVGIFSENSSEKSFYYSPGLIERFEAFLFFVTMVLLPKYFEYLAISFVILVLLTTLIRVAEFSNQARSSKSQRLP